MRVHPDCKAKTEKAAALLGNKSLTEFIMEAALEKAQKVIEEHQKVKLINTDFDAFVSACEANARPGKTLCKLAKNADDQGYQ